MSPRTLRRIVFGFAAGTLAGWATGLLRPPRRLDPDTSLGSASRLPQEEFGEPPVPATVASSPAASDSSAKSTGDGLPAAVASPTPAASNVAMTAAGPVDATAAVEAGAPGLTTPSATPIPTPAALAKAARGKARRTDASTSDKGPGPGASAGADKPPAGPA